jgi:hypothetical protein
LPANSLLFLASRAPDAENGEGPGVKLRKKLP